MSKNVVDDPVPNSRMHLCTCMHVHINFYTDGAFSLPRELFLHFYNSHRQCDLVSIDTGHAHKQDRHPHSHLGPTPRGLVLNHARKCAQTKLAVQLAQTVCQG